MISFRIKEAFKLIFKIQSFSFVIGAESIDSIDGSIAYLLDIDHSTNHIQIIADVAHEFHHT